MGRQRVSNGLTLYRSLFMKLTLKGTPAIADCVRFGPVWLAFRDGVPVALRYQSHYRRRHKFDLPPWVYASHTVCAELSKPIDTTQLPSPTLGKIKKVAIRYGYDARGPRGGKVKASLIAQAAQSVIRQYEYDLFREHRKRCFEELLKRGCYVVAGVVLEDYLFISTAYGQQEVLQ